jgi:hypothetical protein
VLVSLNFPRGRLKIQYVTIKKLKLEKKLEKLWHMEIQSLTIKPTVKYLNIKNKFLLI